MKFTKMHGLGNDYLYVFSESEPTEPGRLSIKLSDRHFGVGSDGMIWILPSRTADFKMRIFNADGSEAAMCGNGIRCVGKYVYDKGYTDKTRLTVETLSGIKTLELRAENGKVADVSVGMGKAVVGKPMTLGVCGAEVVCTPVSMGNPHAVVFTAEAKTLNPETFGAEINRNPAFPGGVNVEFVSVLSDNMFRMRVRERGSGVTLACGTGACAAAAAAVAAGLYRAGVEIIAVLDGGELAVSVAPDYAVTMKGPAEFICEGEACDDKP